MRQRAQLHAPRSANGSQIKQRRNAGRESVTSWEITSERSTSPEAPAPWDLSIPYGNSICYQNSSSLTGSLWQTPQEDLEGAPPSVETPDLSSYHLLYRTPLHVPDNQYETYLLGQHSKRKRQAPIFTKTCCAHTCGGFSVVATIFLLFIGLLIDTQPLYIRGTLPQLIVQGANHQGTKRMAVKYQLPDGEMLPAARTAYRTAFAYFLTAILCYMIVYPGWIQSKWYRWKKRYEDIPDNSSSTDSTLPMFYTFEDSTNSPSMATTSAAYKVHVWNRASAWIRQWLTARGWYGVVRKKFHRKHEQKIG